MNVEDLINALRWQSVQTPFAWLICFENRPLQGIPPKGNGPHIMVFSEENKAHTFMIDRKRFYGEEPLSVVGIDSPDSLKTIALGFSGDPRYAAPPCGIVFDFQYSTKKARKIITPADVASMLPVEIAGALGYIAAPAAVIEQPAGNNPKMGSNSRPGKKRPAGIALITCSLLLGIALALLCIGAVWVEYTRGAIHLPAVPFFSTSTPAATSTPEPASTPTLSPTPIATLTATPVVWTVNAKDDFSANTNGWSTGVDKGQYGSSNLAIQNGKLIWEMTSVKNCWYWWRPDLPSVSDFDFSVDVQRVGGSTNADYGVVLRATSADNSFYYLAIDDVSQEYAFFLYQNEKWTKISDWTFNQAIRTGTVNRIQVLSKGSHFIFIVNDETVGESDDATLSNGKIGILAELYDSGDKIDLEYDNLIFHGNY